MTVSVVIPAYNARGTIFEVVSAARDQDLDQDLEVIVVDDGSTDGTAGLAERAGARVIRQENRGPAAARNAGFRAARGEVVLFTDSDCRARRDWASSLLAGLSSDNVGAAAGTYGIWNRSQWLARQIHSEIIARHSRMGRFVRSFGSYNVAVRREILERLGGFDESFRRASGEDFDLAFRILKSGYKIAFMRDAVVDHLHTESLVKYLKEQARHGFWRMLLYKRHPDMAKGDDYTLLKDSIEAPMALLILGLWPLALVFGGGFANAAALLTLIYGALQFGPLAAGDWPGGVLEGLPFAGVTFLRGFARSLGLARGILRFGIGI